MKRIITDNRQISSFEKDREKAKDTLAYGVKVAAKKRNATGQIGEFSTFLKINKSS